MSEWTFVGFWNVWLLLYGTISSQISYMNDYSHIPIFFIDEHCSRLIHIYLNTAKFFFMYNTFFYRDFENKTTKIRKINICKRRILHTILHVCKKFAVYHDMKGEFTTH